ncbi:ABC transporter substrate-binding protein [Candidatus Bipolaricaulota bacterium]|jgi:NitT/TauT family transport system substrate-binding protein|nr:ABC transporter substrate-binding protein [Candidatus Bipolaricaulota bacterium]
MRRAWFFALFCLLIFSAAVVGETLPTLRFSLPPVLEALPIAFADAWGLFEEHGVDVELVGTTDNQTRSIAFSANKLDGMFVDVTRSIYDATTGSDVLITSTASLRPQTDSIGLAVLSPATHFGYETFEALIDSGQAISTIFRSDYEYVLDLYLQETLGMDARSVRTTYWNDTLQMAVWFGAQTLPSAMLPEPYISYISTYHPPDGQPIALNVLADLSSLGPLPTILVFQSSYVEENPAAVEAFYAAYVEAIERINTTPRDVLIDEGIDIALGLFFLGADRTTINQEVLDVLAIPYYELPSTLSQELYDSVGQWMLGKAYVYTLPEYDDIVDFQFIP